MSSPNAADWPRQSLPTRVLSWLLNPGGAPSLRRVRRAVENKTVLITGASFGIGEACARLLATAGAKVLLAARSKEQLELLAVSIRAEGGKAEVHPLDLTDIESVAALGNHLLEKYGSIDVVVSNAGKSIRRSVALSYDRFHDFERTIGVNYMGPVRLILALLPEMRRRRSGQIINVSTFGVRVAGGPRWGAYQASKAAFNTWFRSMGIEARCDGVVTSSIYLPLVYTRMSAPTPSLRGLPGMYPEQAAGLVARAIVHQSRSISPWWLWPGEILSVIFRRPLEWGMSQFFKHSTDSPSARGMKVEPPISKPSKSQRTPSLRQAFHRVGLLPRRPSTLIRMARAVLVQGGRPSGLCALNARSTPDRTAVVDESGAITYAELNERAERLSSALRDQFAIGPGSGFGIMCRNHRGFVESLVASSATGADTVLINTEFPGPQLAQVLANNKLDCFVHDAEFSSAVAQSGCRAKAIVVTEPSEGLSVEKLVESNSRRLQPVSKRGRVVILTSGTTGIPKGAPRKPSFRSLSGSLTTLLTTVPFRAGATILIAPPLFHGMGLAYLNLALLLGATVVVRRRFDAVELLADIARHRVAIVIAVPVMLKRLVNLPEAIRSQHELSSLRAVLTSGSALSGELSARFMKSFGPCLYNLYGSSESGFGAIATPVDLQEAPGTVGYPPVGTELHILDTNGQPLPSGQVGRVFVKSGLAFSGYTGGGVKETVNGCVCTGDLGHFDASGRLFIDGRSDDMIKSGAEIVFPLEIEEALGDHPGVAEVAVIGVSDAEFGQRLKAFVVRREGIAMSEDDLRAFLKERVARFKVPRDFVFVAKLPRNALGKVVKRDLHDSDRCIAQNEINRSGPPMNPFA